MTPTWWYVPERVTLGVTKSIVRRGLEIVISIFSLAFNYIFQRSHHAFSDPMRITIIQLLKPKNSAGLYWATAYWRAPAGLYWAIANKPARLYWAIAGEPAGQYWATTRVNGSTETLGCQQVCTEPSMGASMVELSHCRGASRVELRHSKVVTSLLDIWEIYVSWPHTSLLLMPSFQNIFIVKLNLSEVNKF